MPEIAIWCASSSGSCVLTTPPFRRRRLVHTRTARGRGNTAGSVRAACCTTAVSRLRRCRVRHRAAIPALSYCWSA
eukprot:2075873-Pleurochrysis_carterae.AAC.1